MLQAAAHAHISAARHSVRARVLRLVLLGGAIRRDICHLRFRALEGRPALRQPMVHKTFGAAAADTSVKRDVFDGSDRIWLIVAAEGSRARMPDDPESTPNNPNGVSPPLDSTFDLIERARGGDSDALERLLARHLAPLRRWVSGRLPRWARDLADTDDLVQDTLLRTFRKIEGFEVRGVGALQAYLRQAVLNRVRDELRQKARAPLRVDAEGLNLEGVGSPLEEAIGREAFARYEAALARLKPEEREAIIGRVEMEYTYAELAEALGKPSAEAARKAAQRALLRLAEEMGR